MNYETKENLEILFSWMVLIGVVASVALSAFTYSNLSKDRRDVNRDGVVDIVDLSVLATEINAANQ